MVIPSVILQIVIQLTVVAPSQPLGIGIAAFCVSRHERTLKEKMEQKVVFDSAFSRQQLLNKQQETQRYRYK
jgi:hypothetical protein